MFAATLVGSVRKAPAAVSERNPPKVEATPSNHVERVSRNKTTNSHIIEIPCDSAEPSALSTPPPGNRKDDFRVTVTKIDAITLPLRMQPDAVDYPDRAVHLPLSSASIAFAFVSISMSSGQSGRPRMVCSRVLAMQSSTRFDADLH